MTTKLDEVLEYLDGCEDWQDSNTWEWHGTELSAASAKYIASVLRAGMALRDANDRFFKVKSQLDIDLSEATAIHDAWWRNYEVHKGPTCNHEYVNQGFTSILMACKHCGEKQS